MNNKKELITNLYPSNYIKLILLVFIVIIASNCSKDCKRTEYTFFVNKSYLPMIIPYNDTSTRLFLKNGLDTLAFKSEGLVETTNKYYTGEGTCDVYNLQNYSLTLYSNNNERFKIDYFVNKENIGRVVISGYKLRKIQELADIYFLKYYPPLVNLTTMNNKYDTVTIMKSDYGDSIYIKPRIGLLKIKTNNDVYELIK